MDGHRKKGLWAFDIVNPNAWLGAVEAFASSAADFIAVQEAKVEQEENKTRRQLRKGKAGRFPSTPVGTGMEAERVLGSQLGVESTWVWRSPLRMKICLKSSVAVSQSNAWGLCVKAGCMWPHPTCTVRCGSSINLTLIYSKP